MSPELNYQTILILLWHLDLPIYIV